MQPITVTFQAAIAPATVTAHSVWVFGRWSGTAQGTRSVSPDGRTISFTPTRPWFVGEMLTMQLSSAISGAAGGPLTGGHVLQFMVTSAPGSRQFTNQATLAMRQAGEGTIGTYGIYAGDVDRDGAPDLTAMNEISNDVRVFLANGCGGYGPMTRIPNPGQWPSPNDGSDCNRDGWLDLVTGNQNGNGVSVWLNNGAGMYGTPAVYAAGGYVHGIGVADFNGDGWPDLAAPNGNTVSVFLNLGNGAYGPRTDYDVGSGEDHVGCLDADEDGHVDLVVGCSASNNMGVLRGQGNGTFVLGQTRATGGNPFNMCYADCNGDGHVDVTFATRTNASFGILFGAGNGTFSAVTSYAVGSLPAAIDLADLDGDGDVDVVVSNYGSANYTLWYNRGDGVFVTPATLTAPRSGSCATLVDFDRDGVLDIIGTDEVADVALLYRQSPGPVPTNSQPPSCAAALRVDQRGDRAGQGTRPAAPLAGGRTTALNVSGPAGQPVVLVYGLQAATAVPLFTWGLLHLDLGQPLGVVANGLIPGTADLDAKGELTTLLPVPVGLGGLPLTFQAAVGAGPGVFVLTNAQGTVLTP